jgi:hypothetical protein
LLRCKVFYGSAQLQEKQDLLCHFRATHVIVSVKIAMSTFGSLSDKISFAAEEEKILAHWKEIDAFHTSLKLSENKPEYTFYDGPPFATGLPHYG